MSHIVVCVFTVFLTSPCFIASCLSAGIILVTTARLASAAHYLLQAFLLPFDTTTSFLLGNPVQSKAPFSRTPYDDYCSPLKALFVKPWHDFINLTRPDTQGPYYPFDGVATMIPPQPVVPPFPVSSTLKKCQQEFHDDDEDDETNDPHPR